METYYSSIFNEVFGPVMVGTSSSHTAGPYRIGAMARMLLKDPVKKGRISFDPNSSYASYYKLQWSDRGFVAGLRVKDFCSMEALSFRSRISSIRH